MTRSTQSVLVSLGLLASTAVLVPAQAALVNLCGPTVCYEYNNDGNVNAGMNTFGNPSLLGNSDVLEFTPTNFVASSFNGALTTIQTVFQFTRVYSTVGGEIDSITVAESGDYRIIGGGTVANNLRLQVVDQVNDYNLPGFPETIVDIQNFTESTPTGFVPANWSVSSTVSPSAAFADFAGSVSLQVQNTMDAFTYANLQSAFIAKKLVLTTSLSFEPPVVIPVPAAAWLFGSAMGLLVLFRRRLA